VSHNSIPQLRIFQIPASNLEVRYGNATFTSKPEICSDFVKTSVLKFSDASHFDIPNTLTIFHPLFSDSDRSKGKVLVTGSVTGRLIDLKAMSQYVTSRDT
jgi:hypothetical protein